MQKIAVRQGDAAYDVTLWEGGLPRAGEVFDLDRRVLVVTDSGVPAGLAAAVAAACRQAQIYTFPAGENSKNLTTYGGILSAALLAGLTRGDAIVAVGGGVTGDLSGFAAATYLRGIDFYNIPTTLLSQVDSSVGGKTGVDLAGVKNAAGAFFAPRGVLIDPAVLSSLSLRQFRAGLAEIVKIAATCDAALFETLDKADFSWGSNADAPIGGKLPQGLCGWIARAVENKRDIVEKDPLEKGLRRVLNFGHTLGHAVESAAGGALLHGECVAIGMPPFAAGEARARICALLQRIGLPTAARFGGEELLPYLTHDKKACGEEIVTVLVEKIGQYAFCPMTAREILKKAGETV